MPQISILIPVYGVEKYIERCAVSLFEQSYDDIEYIFVNDCTKDNSVQILESVILRYPNRKDNTRIINHEKNLGLAGARLTGLNAATGEYIWFVDSDDWIEPNTVELVAKHFFESYDLISFSYIEEYKDKIKYVTVPDLNTKRVLMGIITPSVWKYIIKRSLFFDFEIRPILGINFAEDLLLTAKLVAISKRAIVLSNNYLYHYNCFNDCSMMSNVTIPYLENAVDATLSIYDFYEANDLVNKYYSYLNWLLATYYLQLASYNNKYKRLTEVLNRIKRSDRVLYCILKIKLNTQTKNCILNYYRILTTGRISKL